MRSRAVFLICRPTTRTVLRRVYQKQFWTTCWGVRLPEQGLPSWRSPIHCTTQRLAGLCSASSSEDNIVEFLLADIGEGIAEVEVLQWFVQPGDVVHQFDRVCEVQSDKATVEITSRYDGQVRKLGANIGDLLKVGTPLLYIATTQTQHGETANNNYEKEESSKLYSTEEADTILRIPSALSSSHLAYATDSSSTDIKVTASPAVRKLGKEHNINLSTLQGSGPKGRLLKSDVMRYVAVDTDSNKAPTSHQQPLEHGLTPSSISSTPNKEEHETIVPLRGYNRLMFQRMTESLTIPHMMYGDEVRMTNLMMVRSQLKSVAMQHYNLPNLTYLPFFLKAASLALQNFPILNSSLSTTQSMALVYHKQHNIGVAMDTPRGLVVAVVRDCQEKSLIEIALDLHRLQTLANQGNLSESDVNHATFSISNIGAIGGGTYMSPVVIPPTVAIGAMGRIQRIPCVGTNDKIEAVDVMNVSWGADHRIVDGATLARFSNSWKGFIEQPTTIMLTLR